jgi:site-specific recombinase XerD
MTYLIQYPRGKSGWFTIPDSVGNSAFSDWIDTRHKNKAKPYREQMLRNIWSDACAAAGVEYKHPYQSFRHGTITGWLDSGMSEDDASSLVGHKCRSTIKKYDKSKRIERLMKAKENL